MNNPVKLLAVGCAAALAGAAAPSAIPDRNSPDFEARFQAEFYYPPPPAPPEATEPMAGQVADANYFRAFPKLDRSYSPADRARAQAVADRLAKTGALSHEQFVLRVAEIAALADNAHTAIGEDALRKNTPRIPLRTYPFADGLFVLWSDPALTRLLGARIDRIDGTLVTAVQRSLRRYMGGIPSHRDVALLALLESPAMLKAAGLASRNDRLRLEGVTANGAPFRETVMAEERGPAAWVSSAVRTLYPREPGAKMVSFLKPGAGMPLALSDASKLLDVQPAPDGGIYIDMMTNMDTDDQKLEDFLTAALDKIAKDRPAYAVLDLRMDGGGDFTKSVSFAQALPKAMQGRPVYLLTSPWTFSAGITTAAVLKSAGGRAVKIVGANVGDRLDFWAEGGSMMLPNSYVQIHYASGRHVYNGRCLSGLRCYWLLEGLPLGVKSLAPDIYAPWTFAAYRNRRDPAMEKVLADFRGRRAR